ncbi:methyl-accepting chemotaxis protein [Butyrivibrio sp. JL13D10]|uniref:methyl-accepting chemotaxis protein n=1 Tax=Butyrivibrio sp. JL13D10 TaxID=3236815 RepID=UPI0038B46A96
MSNDSLKKAGSSPKAISAKISLLFVAMLLITILVAEGITFSLGYSMIKDLIYNSLQNEVSVDANKVNRELNSTFYYLNGVADAIEQNEFASNEDIMEYLAGTVGRYTLLPTGTYVMLNDKTFIYPADPTYKIEDCTENVMYKEAMTYTNSWFYYYDVPYFDKVTGGLCASVIRHVHLKDGREGAFAADMFLSSVQEDLGSVQLYQTGGAMMITAKGLLLTYKNAELCGSNISDVTDDPFLTAIGSYVAEESGKDVHEVANMKVGGDNYYVVASQVSGTDWFVITYAKQKEVLSALFRLVAILVCVTVVAIAAVIIIMNIVLKKLIKNPVTSLTGNIEKISGGDFTVNISSNGNDEIAYMNNAMGDFVNGMRTSLSEIKDVSGRLLGDAQNSKNTAEDLEGAANEQSASMNQIRENIENMAQAVNDVAENATILAQTVASVTDQEQHIEETMNELVAKADSGQHEMADVANEMNDIVDSMKDMADAVSSVDEAADKINQIIDLINSISSQTNLLSLNASIEAARAGEAGKGFAVVAQEIGQLAQNSADATKQIGDIIKDMSARVQQLSDKSEANTQLINSSAESINNAATTFREITQQLSDANEILTTMAGQMEKVNDVATNMASVSEEQSASTQEIANNVDRVTEAAKGVATSSELVANAASSVSEAVDTINGNLDRFTIS